MSDILEIDSPASDAVPETPDISPVSLKNKNPAIRDEAQAFAVANSIINDNKDRIELFAKIQREIDAIDPPFDPGELVEEGKDWKSNINTGFLQTVVNKVAPRLVGRIKKIASLTSSSLDEDVPDSIKKTAHFRKTITKSIRSWKKWHTILQTLSYETSSFGASYPTWTDPFSWKPKIFRGDRAFVPNNTEQLEENLPFYVTKQEYKVHELFHLISDKDAAKSAGWDIDKTVEAINQAHPRREEDENEREKARDFEDLKREVVSATSFEEGSNVIKCLHLFALEHDGKVSQRLLCVDTNKELFKADDRYENMFEVTIPFTFQYGNGTVHGSYGIGHLIYDIAINIEQNRNATIDSLRNQQKFIIQVADVSDLERAKLTITDDAVYSAIGTFAGHTGALPSSVEASLTLDRNLVAKAEEKVGAFLPDPFIQQDETATKSNIEAQKELEVREAILDHYLTFFGWFITEIQKRLVKPDSDDPIAKQCRKELLKVLSSKEIKEIANKPAILTTADFTGSKDAQNIQFMSSKVGNPNYRQNQMEFEISNIVAGPDLTARIFIPEEDQTEQIEATRMQILENDSLMQGKDIPVSPRDNDLVHMSILKGTPDENGQLTGLLPLMARAAAEGAQQGNGQEGAAPQPGQAAEKSMIAAQALLKHYIAHVNNAVTVVISWQGRTKIKDGATLNSTFAKSCGTTGDKRRQVVVNAFIY